MRLLLVALVALLALGCSGEKKNVTGPSERTSAAFHETRTLVSQRWVDATHLEKTYMLSREIHGQTVTIGTIKVIYVCDYPVGFMGPLPPGHCDTSGGRCS